MMKLPTRQAITDRRLNFSERLGLAQPVLAAASLCFFSALFVFPILSLVDDSLESNISISNVMNNFELGRLYSNLLGVVSESMTQLVEPIENFKIYSLIAGIGVTLLMVWIIMAMLVSQWRSQVAIVEPIKPLRYGISLLTTVGLLGALFWLIRELDTSMMDAQALPVAILVFLFSFSTIFCWYFAISGEFMSWRALVSRAFMVSFFSTAFTWGFGTLAPMLPLDTVIRFLFVLAHLFMMWLLVVIGVHSLAWETLGRSPWLDLDDLNRGQQVNLGLAILKIVASSSENTKWISKSKIMNALRAKNPLIGQALNRLTQANLIRKSGPFSLNSQWMLSTASLSDLSLANLMEAFGATLNPEGDLLAEKPNQALKELAEQEQRILRTDIETLLKGDQSLALTENSPSFISLFADRDLNADSDGSDGLASASKNGPITQFERLQKLIDNPKNELLEKKPPPSQINDSFPAFSPPKPPKKNPLALQDNPNALINAVGAEPVKKKRQKKKSRKKSPSKSDGLEITLELKAKEG